MANIIIPSRRNNYIPGKLKIKESWINRGLYCCNVGKYGDIFNNFIVPNANSFSYSGSQLGECVAQASTTAQSDGMNFPKRLLSSRTEIFQQLCLSRRVYGVWIRCGPNDCILGEFSNTELNWRIHGEAWNTYTTVFSGEADRTLVGIPRVIGTTWGKNVNSGYGKVFVDGISQTRTGGTPQTVDSARTHSTAYSVYGSYQGLPTYISIFAAFSQNLSDEEMEILGSNIYELFTPVKYATYFDVPSIQSTPKDIGGLIHLNKTIGGL